MLTLELKWEDIDKLDPICICLRLRILLHYMDFANSNYNKIFHKHFSETI